MTDGCHVPVCTAPPIVPAPPTAPKDPQVDVEVITPAPPPVAVEVTPQPETTVPVNAIVDDFAAVEPTVDKALPVGNAAVITNPRASPPVSAIQSTNFDDFDAASSDDGSVGLTLIQGGGEALGEDSEVSEDGVEGQNDETFKPKSKAEENGVRTGGPSIIVGIIGAGVVALVSIGAVIGLSRNRSAKKVKRIDREGIADKEDTIESERVDLESLPRHSLFSEFDVTVYIVPEFDAVSASLHVGSLHVSEHFEDYEFDDKSDSEKA